MLIRHLPQIKGELLVYFFESVKDISNSRNGLDYEAFYEDYHGMVTEIANIKTLNDLDRFFFNYATDDVNCIASFSYFEKKYCMPGANL